MCLSTEQPVCPSHRLPTCPSHWTECPPLKTFRLDPESSQLSPFSPKSKETPLQAAGKMISWGDGVKEPLNWSMATFPLMNMCRWKMLSQSCSWANGKEQPPSWSLLCPAKVEAELRLFLPKTRHSRLFLGLQTCFWIVERNNPSFSPSASGGFTGLLSEWSQREVCSPFYHHLSQVWAGFRDQSASHRIYWDWTLFPLTKLLFSLVEL